MLLLALDTSTSASTAAIHDGSRVLAHYDVIDARAHGERLAPGIEHVLRDAGADPADLTDVVAGLGPGPFTGLRVGVVTARMLALATGATLRGLCSLDALAFAAQREHPVDELLVATDARRKEVYWARYAGAHRLAGPAVARPASLPADLRSLPTVGRGPLLYSGLFPRPAPPLDVSARDLADLAVQRLAAGDPLEAHEPLYLRRPDVAPASARKAAAV